MPRVTAKPGAGEVAGLQRLHELEARHRCRGSTQLRHATQGYGMQLRDATKTAMSWSPTQETLTLIGKRESIRVRWRTRQAFLLSERAAAAPAEEASTAAPAAAGAGGIQAAVLRLQRSAGNAAVGALLDGRPRGTAIARSVSEATEPGEGKEQAGLGRGAARGDYMSRRTPRPQHLAAPESKPSPQHNLSTPCFEQTMAVSAGRSRRPPSGPVPPTPSWAPAPQAKMGMACGSRRRISTTASRAALDRIRYAAFLIRKNPSMSAHGRRSSLPRQPSAGPTSWSTIPPVTASSRSSSPARRPV